MPRYKIVNNERIQLTVEEEAQMDADQDASDLDLTLVRVQRNGMLRESDWTQLPGGPLTDEQKTAWDVHRQELRDYPAQSDKVSTLPEWPTPPD